MQSLDLIKAGNFHYIQNVQYTDSRTQRSQRLSYTPEQIQQFYLQDIADLKYAVFGVGLFALAALFVSFRILRNFRKFLNK